MGQKNAFLPGAGVVAALRRKGIFGSAPVRGGGAQVPYGAHHRLGISFFRSCPVTPGTWWAKCAQRISLEQLNRIVCGVGGICPRPYVGQSGRSVVRPCQHRQGHTATLSSLCSSPARWQDIILRVETRSFCSDRSGGAKVLASS